MPVTEVSSADREAILSEIERLTESSILHGSEALCRLVRYLAEQYLAHPGSTVKEYQLAIDVFGRPADFDPRLDSTVRVQTGRLRSKMAEYYAGIGAEDPLILELPKGSYSLAFHYRPASKMEAAPVAAARLAEPPFVGTPVPTAALRNPLLPLVWALAAISVVLLAGLLVSLLRGRAARSKAPVEETSSTLRRFWTPFLDTADPPWIIFSNAEFTGTPQDGMRYFDPSRDSRNAILDHYTGVGEVLGVAELTRVFNLFNHEVRIKRGRLLTLDDVKTNNVIFLGSSAENLALREITTTQEFTFRRIDSGLRAGETELVNVHPRDGEPALYVASQSLPIVEDYALIGLVPGINPSRWMLVLAGTTTMGTQAAAEFVCREDSLNSLLRRIGGGEGPVKPFEAVIRVHVSGGVPVKSTIIASRVSTDH